MKIPADLKYTTSHEWVRIKGDIATVGITEFATHQLSELTFVELPEKDDEVTASDEVAVVESVKAASDVYSPVSGKIVAVNTAVVDNPEIINGDPYGDGWLFRVQMSNKSEMDDLWNADQYDEQLPEEE